MKKTYAYVVIEIAQWRQYVVACADTPAARAADRVDPDCGFHISQSWN